MGKRYSLFVIGLILILFLRILYSSEVSSQERLYRTVTNVIDDFTLEFKDGERLRLIGIDIPRDFPKTKKYRQIIDSFNKISFLYLKNLLNEKQVSIDLDEFKRDRFGRYLGYVYLPDGTFINLKLIKEGYAQAIRNPINRRYYDLFLEAESEARKSREGLWGILGYLVSRYKLESMPNLNLLKDGSYVGSDKNVLGEVTLRVTLKDSKIQDIEILKNTFAHCKPISTAFEIVPQRVISAQSLDVDAVTGATVSSTSIKRAVLNALRKASQQD